MNFIIPALSANLTFGLISAITSTTNSVYTLANNVTKSSSKSIDQIKLLIMKRDLTHKMNLIKTQLNEIKITDKSSETLLLSIEGLNEALIDIDEELKTIHYRINYNKSIVFAKFARSYKFDNCFIRLESKINVMESRYECLNKILLITTKLSKKTNKEENPK
jgi:hypothetical protein